MKKIKLKKKLYKLYKSKKSNKKLITTILYEEFQKLIPKSTIEKALKKVELF